MSLNFKKEEVIKLVIASAVLGFVFGFDDKQPLFDLNFWIANFLLMVLLSAFSITLYAISRKLIANKIGLKEEFDLWSIKRIGIKKTHLTKWGIPLWLIFPFFITILTEGRIPFSGISRSFLTANPTSRFGREFKEVTEWEKARISATPILTAAFVALLFNLFDGNLVTKQLILINLSLAISNLIPLPNLDGFHLFFASRPLFVFVLAFVLIIALLIYLINSFAALVLATLIAFIVLCVFYYYAYIKQ